MRKWKWLAVIGLLLFAAGKVEAQCSGYSSDSPTQAALTPDKVAAQGFVTATITGQASASESNGNPGTPSHNLTVTSYGNSGTLVTITVSSSNGSTAVMSNTLDGAPYGQPYSVGLNSTEGFVAYPSWNGHVIGWKVTVTASNGNTTQDRIFVTVTAGNGPRVISQDSAPINFYAYMGSSFHGPSMLNSCSTCQLHPNVCINKMHHPKQHWQVTNATTGEYHDAGWVYGQPACENCAVSYSGSSPFISMMPGDQLSFNVENTVICDEFGVIYDNNGGDEFAWDTEYAFTTEKTIPSMCQILPEPNGQAGIECPVVYNCQPAAGTPDFNPAYLASDLWCATANYCNDSDIPNFPKNWLTGAWGARVKVFGAWTPWFFPFYESSGFVIGLRKTSDFINYLYSFGNLAVPSPLGANPINCTNKDRGTSPLPPYWP